MKGMKRKFFLKRMWNFVVVMLIPALLRGGFGFWTALAAGCVLTIALYLLMMQVGPRLGLRI